MLRKLNIAADIYLIVFWSYDFFRLIFTGKPPPHVTIGITLVVSVIAAGRWLLEDLNDE